MSQVMTKRTRRLLREDVSRSIFRCPECGSFFDTARENPETGSLARKCLACNDWYPILGAPPRELVR